MKIRMSVSAATALVLIIFYYAALEMVVSGKISSKSFTGELVNLIGLPAKILDPFVGPGHPNDLMVKSILVFLFVFYSVLFFGVQTVVALLVDWSKTDRTSA
jgi:hypothetical protein